MDGPVLAAQAAASGGGGGNGLEGWSAGLKCVFNSLENLPPDDPTALYYTVQWCVIWDLICMEIYFSYFWPAYYNRNQLSINKNETIHNLLNFLSDLTLVLK